MGRCISPGPSSLRQRRSEAATCQGRYRLSSARRGPHGCGELVVQRGDAKGLGRFTDHQRMEPKPARLAGFGSWTLLGKRTCKPNSVVCGHSSRRRVTADTHQRPTRRFRHLLEAPQRRRPVAGDPARAAFSASGRHAAPPGSWRQLPSLFGLAPCGVYPASGLTAGAVRSYRTFSPLLRHRARPPTQLRRTCLGSPSKGGVAGAVSFLWHWPSAGLQARS